MSGLSWRVRTRRRLGAAIVAAAVATLGLIGFVPAAAQASSGHIRSVQRRRGDGVGRRDAVCEKRRGADADRTAPAMTRSASTSQARSPVIRSGTAKSTWTFSFTAGAGDGVQAVTATASPGVNPQNKCTGSTSSASASYVLDNTGPVVTAALSPSPNAAGWNNSNVDDHLVGDRCGLGCRVRPDPGDRLADREHRRGYQDRDGDRPARQRRHRLGDGQARQDHPDDHR